MEHNLFPTRVYQFTSSLPTHDLVEPILNLDKQKDLHYGEDSGGWKGGGMIFQTSVFQPIKEFIERKIQQTFNQDFKITDVWVSIYNKGDYNKIHNHLLLIHYTMITNNECILY